MRTQVPHTAPPQRTQADLASGETSARKPRHEQAHQENVHQERAQREEERLRDAEVPSAYPINQERERFTNYYFNIYNYLLKHYFLKKLDIIFMKSYYYPLEKLPGISQETVALFKAYGITNTQQLLKQTQTLEAQQLLANNLKIKLQYVRKWSALADLARIKSVGCTYCGLILHSGIVSVLQFT